MASNLLPCNFSHPSPGYWLCHMRRALKPQSSLHGMHVAKPVEAHCLQITDIHFYWTLTSQYSLKAIFSILTGLLVWSNHWCSICIRNLPRCTKLSCHYWRWTCYHWERNQEWSQATRFWTRRSSKSKPSWHANTNSLWTENNSVASFKNLM